MAIFDFLKKNKEKERFLKKKKNKSVIPVLKEEAVKEKKVKKEKIREIEKIETKRKSTDFKEEFLVLERPILTEKSTALSESGAYVFGVIKKANKIMIKHAVEKFYNVKVRSVNTNNVPAKKIFMRGKKGSRPGYKKAIVYLEKGEKIEI